MPHHTKPPQANPLTQPQGILLIDKPKGKTSFSLVSLLRKLLRVKTIGHAGTLDPMATGVMVLLVGKKYTAQSMALTGQDKEYEATITLGTTTDSYDAEGTVVATSRHIPSVEEVAQALQYFNGTIEQIPPMFSAKKVDGKKLYDLARKGQEVERKPVSITLKTTLLDYAYPFVKLHIACSKGTYIRSIAHELGERLSCGGHLSALVRTRSGSFNLPNCVSGKSLFEAPLEEARQLALAHLTLS